MKDIYSEIVDCSRTKKASVLATIINRKGSSPRGIGTKLLITEDGGLAGSVGGGELEKAVIETSSRVTSSILPVFFKSDPGMSCGGDVEIFVEPISPDNEVFFNIYSEIAGIVKRGGSGLLATVVDTRLWKAGQTPKALFKANGEVIGILPNMQETFKAVTDAMPAFSGGRMSGTITCNDEDGEAFRIFIESIISDPVLYIFGAGHVSSQVVPVARRVGFKITVIDDRPEFAESRNFPDADRVLIFPYDDVVKRFAIDESSYIVITTRSHSCDETVLGQALRTEAGYIGMIGSRRKISNIYNNLQKEGFTDKDFKRVHSPIGIDIGAETPEEIALSIVAELVKVRAG